MSRTDRYTDIELCYVLEGVCCFAYDETEAMQEYNEKAGAPLVMIFDGEELGRVHDGTVASVKNVIAVVPEAEFWSKIDACADYDDHLLIEWN